MQPNLLLVSKILPQIIIKVGKLHIQEMHKFTSNCSPQRCKVIPEFGENVAAPTGNVSQLLHIGARSRLDEDLSASKQLDRRTELDENSEKLNHNSDTVWDPSK